MKVSLERNKIQIQTRKDLFKFFYICFSYHTGEELNNYYLVSLHLQKMDICCRRCHLGAHSYPPTALLPLKLIKNSIECKL